MRRISSAFVLAVLITPAAATAQTSAVTKGSPVTFSGCVVQGTHRDSFLLTGVQRTDGVANNENTVFWLDSPDKLRGHAGHLVEVSGTISKLDDGTLKIKVDPKKDLDTKIEVTRGTDRVAAEVDTKPVGTSGKTAQIEEPRTILKLKVRSLRMLSPSCAS
jgi:hypothetical protein